MDNLRKIFAIFFVFLVVSVSVGSSAINVYGAINESYFSFPESTDNNLDEIISSSRLLDYIGSFIYAIGNVVESLVSNIMNAMGLGKFFPWSDFIIFNAIPILDVNFINPATNSLVGNSSIGQVIRNVYFTGLTVALGFLGIIIAVMAIKLALSTIASDKAKYKEAIVKWLTSLVLLFGMHFMLAFLFFLNEQLVVTASKILSASINENAAKIVETLEANVKDQQEQIVKNFTEAAQPDFWAYLGQGLHTIGAATICCAVGGGIGAAVGGVAALMHSALSDLDGINGATYLKEHQDTTYALINNSTIRKYVVPSVYGNKDTNEGFLSGVFNALGTMATAAFGGKDPKQQQIGILVSHVALIEHAGPDDVEMFQNELKALNDLKDSELDEKGKQDKAVMQVVYSLALSHAKGETYKNSSSFEPSTSSGNSGSNESGGKDSEIISMLGAFFKQNAWYTDVDNGGWSPDQVSIVSATLYTMLVFQSVGFLISYIKRLFMVVVLAVIAPFVVIYDFFNKAISL